MSTRAQSIFKGKIKTTFRMTAEEAERMWSSSFDEELQTFSPSDRSLRAHVYHFTDESFTSASEMMELPLFKRSRVGRTFVDILCNYEDDVTTPMLVTWVKGHLFVVFVAPEDTLLSDLPGSACVLFDQQLKNSIVISDAVAFLRKCAPECLGED